MRLEITVTTPKADSYGRTLSSSYAHPKLESAEEIKTAIDKFFDCYAHFKPDMSFKMEIKEDWTYG